MSEFYDFSIARKKKEVFLDSAKDYNENELRKGLIEVQGNFPMFISEGSKFYDIISFQDTCNFGVSEKLKNALIKNSVTGFTIYPITVNNSTINCFGFQVTGSCGNLIKPKEEGFYLGYKFDIQTWDGSDFFSPKGSNLLFCTEKVKKIVDKLKITNAEIIHLTKVEGYSFGT